MHRIKHKLRNFQLVYWLAFIISISDALAGYIQSSYLKQYISLSDIGLFLGVASLIVLFISTFYHHLIVKITNYRLTISLFILSILSCYFLYTANSATIALTAFIIRYISFMFLATSLDIFLENISDNLHTGAIRTKFLTVTNIAWLASPLIMSHIVGKNNNYHYIYLIGAIILSIALIIVLSNKKYLQKPVDYKKHNIRKALSIMWKKKNILAIFRSGILLSFFYFVASIYIPIYLNETIGLSWATLGIVFTIMLIPFTIFQIPAGIIADRYLGEKEILITGHVIIGLSMILIFFISTDNPIIWATVLFFSRLGAALAESMQETYFFKQVNIKDIDLINLFRRSRSIGWSVGASVSFITIYFISFHYVFLIVSLAILANAISLISLKDTK